MIANGKLHGSQKHLLVSILLILITIPVNRVVAQLTPILPLSSYHQNSSEKRNIMWRGLTTESPLKTKYSRLVQSPAGIRNSLISPHLTPTNVRLKRFNLTGNANYDLGIDKVAFNIHGLFNPCKMISLQLTVFLFNMPRPWLGANEASKLSEISPYQLKGSFTLQKSK